MSTAEQTEDTTAAKKSAKANGTAPDAKKATSTTTTYIAFFIDGDGHIEKIDGEITVKTGQSYKAKQQVLAKLEQEHPDADELTIAVVSAGSWQEETFVKPPPEAPKFRAKRSE